MTKRTSNNAIKQKPGVTAPAAHSHIMFWLCHSHQHVECLIAAIYTTLQGPTSNRHIHGLTKTADYKVKG